MATVIYFTSGAEVAVEELPTDVEAVIARSGQVATLTLSSGELLYFRVDQVTHWHGANGRQGSRDDPPRTKPRFGRGLPRTP